MGQYISEVPLFHVEAGGRRAKLLLLLSSTKCLLELAIELIQEHLRDFQGISFKRQSSAMGQKEP